MSMILPDLPNGIAFGTITGTFLTVLADSNDTGNSPDAVALGGTVTITPVLKSFRITGAAPATVVTQDIKATIVNGTLLGPDGVTPLRVMASDSPNISPSPVQYTAKFALTGVTNQPPTITFSVPSNGTVDLSTVITLPAVAPVQTIVSEQDRIDAEAAAVRAEAAVSGIYDMPPTAITDCNNAPTGYSIAQSTAANVPPGIGATSVVLLTLDYSGFGSPYVFQTATREDTAQVYGRFSWQGVWQPWNTGTPNLTPLGINGPTFSPGNNYWLDMNGRGIYSLAAPTAPDHVATKGYVDSRHVTLTQAEYDALATKDPTVLYIITA